MKVIKFKMHCTPEVASKEKPLLGYILEKNKALQTLDFFELHTYWIVSGHLLGVIRLSEESAVSTYFVVDDESANEFLEHVIEIRMFYMSEFSEVPELLDLNDQQIIELFNTEENHSKEMFAVLS